MHGLQLADHPHHPAQLTVPAPDLAGGAGVRVQLRVTEPGLQLGVLGEQLSLIHISEPTRPY